MCAANYSGSNDNDRVFAILGLYQGLTFTGHWRKRGRGYAVVLGNRNVIWHREILFDSREDIKMKKKTSIISMCFCVLLLVSCLIPSAAAANYAGSPKSVQSGWDGRTYTACSILRILPDNTEGGSDVGAGIEVISQDQEIIERDFIRAEPRLYLDGELFLAEGWHYTNGTDNGMYAEYFTYFTARIGSVFAQSAFGIYNGSGYTNYIAPATRTVSVASVTMRAEDQATPIQEELGVNANGQTYGSGWVDETPDLIKAIGAEGVKGYVYNEDLLSLGDKASINAEPAEIPDSIPLYAEDGTTVVGEFLIGCPNG